MTNDITTRPVHEVNKNHQDALTDLQKLQLNHLQVVANKCEAGTTHNSQFLPSSIEGVLALTAQAVSSRDRCVAFFHLTVLSPHLYSL